MSQCLYLDVRGRRCGRDAEEGTSLCAVHVPLMLPEAAVMDWRRMAFRLAALLLLGIFLLPLVVQGYRMLRALLN